jgi:hypothetical protein
VEKWTGRMQTDSEIQTDTTPTAGCVYSRANALRNKGHRQGNGMATIQYSGGERCGPPRSRVPYRSPGGEVRLPRDGNHCCNSVRFEVSAGCYRRDGEAGAEKSY